MGRVGWMAVALSALCMTVLGARDVRAAFPERSVQLYVGFGPGGGVDLFARRVAQKLGDAWGKPVVVVNKVGADSTIAADFVAHAAADGYTLLMASNSQAVMPAGSPPPYHPLNSFAPITLAAANGVVLVINPAVPATSLKQLIALAKAKPGELNFGNPGTGAPPFLATETLIQRTGIKMTAVPFTGGGPALTSVMGGEIQVLFASITGAAELTKAGKVRALAVSTATRSQAMPDVPTVAEAGDLPNFDVTGWFGILAPAGTPAATVAKIHDDVVGVLNSPDIKASLAKEDFKVIASTPEDFSAFLGKQIRSVAELMAAINGTPK